MTSEEFNELWDSTTKNLQEVYNEFVEFYGESLVDLWGLPDSQTLSSIYEELNIKDWVPNYTNSEESLIDYLRINGKHITPEIVVRFPEVKVENEYGKSVLIWDLWVKTPLTLSGKVATSSFTMARTTFDIIQYGSGYNHSHMFSGADGMWKSVCTGRGPIGGTLMDLWLEYNLDVWRMYIFELSRYVQVESVEGGPMYRMDRIGQNSSFIIDSFSTPKKTLRLGTITDILPDYSSTDLMSHILRSSKLRFTHDGNRWTLGMSFVDTVVTVSNLAIEYLNSLPNPAGIDFDSLLRRSYFGEFIVTPNKLIKKNDIVGLSSRITSNDKILFYFKGEPIKLVVNEVTNWDNVPTSNLLEPPIVNDIIYSVLTVLNGEYGTTEETTASGTQPRYIA